jgi:hypothetical protein
MPPKVRRLNYNDEDLVEAVKAVKEEGISLRAASERYNVPKSTIKDRMSETHGTKMGRPPILSPDEEKMLVERLKILGTWGFPLTKMDFCHFVKAYLDKKGVKTRMKDNMPTFGFVETFLGRHKELTLRVANPIKRARASVSREDVQQFFAHYEQSVEGVLPENLCNYDKTNLRDDPGLKKCFFKKGQKYCEKVQNTSKQA